MAESVIRVSLLGNAKDLQNAFRVTGDQSKTWGQKMEGAGRSLTMGLTAPIVAGAALAVKAGAEEQQAMEVLANTLRKNLPGATDETIAATEAWITAAQNATGIADDKLRPAYANLIIAGMDEAEAQKAMVQAMDVSVAKGLDLEAVTKAIAKGHNGNTAALAKLGIATKDANGKALTMDQIMGNLADTMGGAAAAAADTAAGRAEILKLKMGDLTEGIGMMLLPVVEKLTSALSGLVEWFTNLPEGAKKTILIFAGVAAAVGPVLIVGAKMVKAFQTIKESFGILSKAMSINPWVLLIAAVVALVILIVMNWDKIVAFLKRTWDWIKKTAGAAWDWVKNAVKAAVDFIVKLFMNFTLPGLIMKHWDKIKDGVRAVGDFIKGVWNGVVDFFKAMPGRIAGAVRGLWDGLKNAFRNAVNWVIDKWNGFKLSIKLPALLGGGTLTLNTPNIPRFAGGGIFHAPVPGGAGLAILEDRERVLRPGQNSGAATATELHVHVTTSGIITDPVAVGRAVLEALQTYQRNNGPLPLAVRA